MKRFGSKVALATRGLSHQVLTMEKVMGQSMVRLYQQEQQGQVQHRESMTDDEYESMFNYSKEQLIKQHTSTDRIPYENLKDVEKKIHRPPTGFKPIKEFKEMGLHPYLDMSLTDLGLKKPTPIQEMVLGLPNTDMIATSETGSGKTYAFLLPIVQDLLANNKGGTRMVGQSMPIKALIVQPTRELCQQVHREALKFTMGTPIKVNMAFGASPKRMQSKTILNGTDILVATPGRLLQFFEDGILSLHQLEHLILDEADTMLDMGFYPQIEALLHPMLNMNKHRTTKLFSATFTSNVKRLSENFMKDDYASVAIGRIGSSAMSVEQKFVLTEGSLFNKVQTLVETMREVPGKTLIFCSSKANCDKISGFLSQENMEIYVMHSSKSQTHRTKVAQEFAKPSKNNYPKVLVATDIVARGIDIRDITHVINFDLPAQLDTYTHRIGRTGRVGAKGVATTIVNMNWLKETDKRILQDIHDEFLSQDKTPPAEIISALSVLSGKLQISRGRHKQNLEKQNQFNRLANKKEKVAYFQREYPYDKIQKLQDAKNTPPVTDDEDTSQDRYGSRAPKLQFERESF